MSRKKTIIFAVVLFLLGAIVLLYPLFSNLVNRLHGSYAISEIKQKLEETDASVVAAQRIDAQYYNNQLKSGKKPDNYNQLLNVSNGMMGYIRIPSIGVNLPIYHGVEEDVLTKGVGHMPETSLPIGGEGNHAVLTGHTGLPSAKLFTDLTELSEGDSFSIHVLDDVLNYEIDQIKVVLPSEGEDLMPVSDKDYCTLVTCTPYGVNSHRLLVRGVRVSDREMSPVETVSNHHASRSILWISGIVFIVSILCLVWLLMYRRTIKHLS